MRERLASNIGGVLSIRQMAPETKAASRHEPGSYADALQIFSGLPPATRVAVASFSPLFVTPARALVTALLAAVIVVICVAAARRFA